MKLVEPLRELFKDEVRALGRELGIARERSSGGIRSPGRAWRSACPGAITREKLALLRRADAIFLEEIRAAGLYDAIWQAFAVLLPVRTVGVMGDGRTYDHACALRAVTSHRWDDGGCLSVRCGVPGAGGGPDRQRGARDQPGHVRYYQQAAWDDRVGVRHIGRHGARCAFMQRAGRRHTCCGLRSYATGYACEAACPWLYGSALPSPDITPRSMQECPAQSRSTYRN